jgi:hypothetical protein
MIYDDCLGDTNDAINTELLQHYFVICFSEVAKKYTLCPKLNETGFSEEKMRTSSRWKVSALSNGALTYKASLIFNF